MIAYYQIYSYNFIKISVNFILNTLENYRWRKIYELFHNIRFSDEIIQYEKNIIVKNN